MKFKLRIDKDAEEEVTVIARSPSPLIQQIENLIRNHSGVENIIGYRDDEMRILKLEEIECITILDRKVIAIDDQGIHYRIQERLRDLEEILPPNFIRINKSTIANELRIIKYEATFSGGVDALFQCGYREYVSRRCFAEIRRRYTGK